LDSREVARAALSLALTPDHGQERRLQANLAERGIRGAAVDCGGDAILLIRQGIERAVVAARREGIIDDVHLEVGAVAGAAHAALHQALHTAAGLNAGGKIGIARGGEHVVVAVFLQVGLVHLDDVAVGLGHRALPPLGSPPGRSAGGPGQQGGERR